MLKLEERHSRSKSFLFVDLHSMSLAQRQSIMAGVGGVQGMVVLQGGAGVSDHTAPFDGCLHMEGMGKGGNAHMQRLFQSM